MRSLVVTAFRLLLALTVLTGVIYPLLVTGVAQLLFPAQAGGSLLADGRGSALLGQTFTQPGYFWGRGSLTAPGSYDAAASAGSNLGPLHPDLREGVAGRIAALRAADRDAVLPVPVDLVTASGSGLDPHISPEAARYQVPRVARARALTEPAVQAIVDRRTEGRTFGLLGEPRVNVLLLNQDLDAAEQ
jgi:K+-transporting ATPase ATPase C chain